MPRHHDCRDTPQHPKKLRMGGRPRRWHRSRWSPGIRQTVAFLFTDHETQAQEDAA